MGWEHDMTSLRKFNTSGYLLNSIGDYLNHRSLSYETEGANMKDVTAGAAQGSVLGLDRWKITYVSFLMMALGLLHTQTML